MTDLTVVQAPVPGNSTDFYAIVEEDSHTIEAVFDFAPPSTSGKRAVRGFGLTGGAWGAGPGVASPKWDEGDIKGSSEIWFERV